MCRRWILNHFRFIISTVKLRVKTLTKFVGFIDSNCCYWNIYMFKIFFFSDVYVKMLIRINTADAAKSSWPDRSWNIIKNIYICWCKIIKFCEVQGLFDTPWHPPEIDMYWSLHDPSVGVSISVSTKSIRTWSIMNIRIDLSYLLCVFRNYYGSYP